MEEEPTVAEPLGIVQHYTGKMNKVCPFCKALLFPEEDSGLCCPVCPFCITWGHVFFLGFCCVN